MKKACVILKLAVFGFVLFVCAYFFLLFPEETAKNVENGLVLCIKTVIPSLFPFMVLSAVFTSSIFCEKLSRMLGKATRLFFGLSPFCSTAVLISAIGGYPLGAFTARSLFEKGIISREDFKKLLLFAVLPSPSFSVGAVGSAMLGSKSAGALIYFSSLLSSLALGFCSKFIVPGNDTKQQIYMSDNNGYTISALISSALEKSGRAMLFICFSILFFSAVLAATDFFLPTETARMICAAILEVTCGCKRLSNRVSLPSIAGAVGWGGLCTHFQIVNEVELSGLHTSVFFAFRLLHGALSSLLCSALLKLFPVANETFAFAPSQQVSFSSGSSLAFSLCLIAMSILLLLGNNFVINSKKSTDKIT